MEERGSRWDETGLSERKESRMKKLAMKSRIMVVVLAASSSGWPWREL